MGKGQKLSEIYTEYLLPDIDKFITAVDELMKDAEANKNSRVLNRVKEPLLEFKKRVESEHLTDHHELDDFTIYEEEKGLKIEYNPDPNAKAAKEELYLLDWGRFEDAPTFVIDGLSHDASMKLMKGIAYTCDVLADMEEAQAQYYDLFNDLYSKLNNEAEASVWKQVKKQDAEA